MIHIKLGDWFELKLDVEDLFPIAFFAAAISLVLASILLGK